MTRSLRGFIVVDVDMAAGWSVRSDPDTSGAVSVLRRVADDVPTIPATTVAGALRAHLASELGAEIDELMGPRAIDASDGSSSASSLVASNLWVLDSRIFPIETAGGTPGNRRVDEPATIAVARRGRTAIDRKRGAPLANKLYVDEYVNGKSRLRIWFRYDAPEAEVEELCQRITRWTPRFGHGKSIGRGGGVIASIRYGVLDLASWQGLATAFAGLGPSEIEKIATRQVSVATKKRKDKRSVTAIFTVPNGIRIGTGEEDDTSSKPYLHLARLDDCYVIPGATWKGVLRSRVEYILRTVLGADASCGEAECAGMQSPRCLTCRIFGSTGFSSLVMVQQSELVGFDVPTKKDAKGKLTVQSRGRVAIDRFTGSVKTTALFQESKLEPTSSSTEVRLVINLDHARMNTDEAATITMLLRHAIRDIGEGHVGVGSRTSTGIGTLMLKPGSYVEPELLNVSALMTMWQSGDRSRDAAAQEVSRETAKSPAGIDSVSKPTHVSQRQQDLANECGESVSKRIDGVLVPYGYVSWEQLAALADGMKAAWVDLEGSHLGSIPLTVPVGATHLWAWRLDGSAMIRARIDNLDIGSAARESDHDKLEVVVAMLSCGTTDPSSRPSEQVKVSVRRGVRWDPGSSRLGTQEIPLLSPSAAVDVYDVIGAMPLAFISTHRELQESP